MRGRRVQRDDHCRKFPVIRRLTNLEPMNRIKRGRDVSLIIRERSEQAFPDAIQRHIVIARDSDNRSCKLSAARDLLHVLAGCLVFTDFGALGEVAADHDNVRLQLGSLGQQRLADVWEVKRPEVQIGDVQDREHVGPSIAQSSPGRFHESAHPEDQGDGADGCDRGGESGPDIRGGGGPRLEHGSARVCRIVMHHHRCADWIAIEQGLGFRFAQSRAIEINSIAVND